MDSTGAPKNTPSKPVYFFDQVSPTLMHYYIIYIQYILKGIIKLRRFFLRPFKRDQTKKTRDISYFILTNEGSQLGDSG